MKPAYEAFVRRLAAELTLEQVDAMKDGGSGEDAPVTAVVAVEEET